MPPRRPTRPGRPKPVPRPMPVPRPTRPGRPMPALPALSWLPSCSRRPVPPPIRSRPPSVSHAMSRSTLRLLVREHRGLRGDCRHPGSSSVCGVSGHAPPRRRAGPARLLPGNPVGQRPCHLLSIMTWPTGRRREGSVPQRRPHADTSRPAPCGRSAAAAAPARSAPPVSRPAARHARAIVAAPQTKCAIRDWSEPSPRAAAPSDRR